MFSNGSTFGAWLVMNTKDTYFGGPLHSDLIVDGIVYNYIGKWDLKTNSDRLIMNSVKSSRGRDSKYHGWV
jgi:hypothetical protein